MTHSFPSALPPRRTPAPRTTHAALPQLAQPGRRVLPLRCLDPAMQGFFFDQIKQGDVPYWLVAGDICISHRSLVPYTASGTDEQEWGQDLITL
ncbi:hypothetical protein J2X36_004554 [Methylobacterium sp. BE186]|uniref:hypothetical protein n=1 Tax=Methylobacterium sp. BE186 TaxID=2817715 RepID=UPI00285C8D43|nr:hypothetical protein [Methylobacterium sp. BE186]MDR7039776.1 hypothetical protein [Methylobacterium sp. BE186]